MRLEAVQAAVQAAFNNFLASNKACATKSMLWNPEAAGADPQGCIDLASTKCFKAGKDYNPSAGGADAGGCTAKPIAIPAGSVVAFNAASCPSGWATLTAAENRVIVGTGASYARGATGGANTFTLARAHLPNASLNVYFSKWVYSDDAAGSGKVLMANRNVGSSSANGGLGITAYAHRSAWQRASLRHPPALSCASLLLQTVDLATKRAPHGARSHHIPTRRLMASSSLRSRAFSALMLSFAAFSSCTDFTSKGVSLP